MSRSTVSTFQLFEKWPNEESARLYLEKRLWPEGPICPRHKGKDRITVRKDGYSLVDAVVGKRITYKKLTQAEETAW